MYKNKYSKLKSQIGSAPGAVPSEHRTSINIGIEPHRLIFDQLSYEDQIKLAESNKTYHNFLRFSYNSTFAPDITIPKNCECDDNLNCNKYIAHSKIKNILKKFGEPIPKDGIPILPLLNTILLETIRFNDKTSGDDLVSFGASVLIIEQNAFNGDGLFYNKKLTEVYIPPTVKEIGDNAFANNILTNLYIPPSVFRIGIGAFRNNELTSVNISPSVKYIGYGAFLNNKLTSIDIPLFVTVIGGEAFKNNKLTSITLSPTLTEIGDYAFNNNKLTTINIPPSVNIIGDNAFKKNILKSINIPKSVTKIGNGAFDQNILETVIIPVIFKEKVNEIFSNTTFIIFEYI